MLTYFRLGYWRIFVVFLLSVFLSSCALFQNTVEVNTTVFVVPTFKVEGLISVLAADAKLEGSLEFQYYQKMLEDKLKKAGFQLAGEPAKADKIAFLAYGIDNGETTHFSRPVFGVITGGSYVDNRYVMPVYGVVDVVNTQVTSFARALAVDIVDANSVQHPPVKKLYEARSKSTGECAVMLEVFDEMLEAMFMQFPAANASHQQAKVAAHLNC